MKYNNPTSREQYQGCYLGPLFCWYYYRLITTETRNVKALVPTDHTPADPYGLCKLFSMMMPNPGVEEESTCSPGTRAGSSSLSEFLATKIGTAPWWTWR